MRWQAERPSSRICSTPCSIASASARNAVSVVACSASAASASRPACSRALLDAVLVAGLPSMGKRARRPPGAAHAGRQARQHAIAVVRARPLQISPGRRTSERLPSGNLDSSRVRDGETAPLLGRVTVAEEGSICGSAQASRRPTGGSRVLGDASWLPVFEQIQHQPKAAPRLLVSHEDREVSRPV